jgi:ATP-dependent helicase HrpB
MPPSPASPRLPSWAGDPLPVDGVLDEVAAALDRHGVTVLEAEPGAGKTTRLPLALHLAAPAAQDQRRIVVLQPRRVAARAAARRLASQLGEPVGRTVGLTTRDEHRTSAATRIEVVTEGVVLRRLQRDPSVPDIGTLVFDEFHERSLEADLALAFAVEARAALRDDLRLLVMSATIEGARVARLLGDAPLVRTEGRTHPVRIEHRAGPSDRLGLPAAVREAVVDLLDDGDVLVFLPGVGEIRSVVRHLAEVALPGDPAVLPLHGALAGEDQDRALRPTQDGRRKVVVATDVAETSLTIDGVRGVVDAGWSREPRFDAATGMTGLVTVPASRASADQRAGRAGRTAPGRCIRLWPEREHLARDAQPRPAIITDDLTGAALEIATWGAEVGELALLDPPPAAAWERARATLRELDAIDRDGRVTHHGRRLSALPVPPRIGQLVLRGRDLGELRLACELAAILGDRDPFVLDRDHPASDLAARVRVLRGGRPPAGVRVRRGSVARLRRQADRLERQAIALPEDPADTAHEDAAGGPQVATVGLRVRGRADADPAAPAEPGDPDRAGRLVAQAWPDRVAGLRRGQRGRFLLASGRGATLPDGDLLADAPWLAVAHLDRGAEEARIHLAAALTLDELHTVLASHLDVEEEVAWRDGDVRAERRTTLGALVVGRAPLEDDSPARRYPALLDGLRREGLDLLGWDDEARALRARVRFLRAHQGEQAWPDWDHEALEEQIEELVGPFLGAARRRADLRSIPMSQVLAAQLDRKQRQALDRLAPTHLDVPSGSRLRLDYTDEGPVLRVRVQEMFGATRTPTVVDGAVAVTLHLLSPAQRPVQVTDDLAGFWTRSYPEVRAELRGRYPKHAWPEDPTRAAPRRGTRRPGKGGR